MIFFHLILHPAISISMYDFHHFNFVYRWGYDLEEHASPFDSVFRHFVFRHLFDVAQYSPLHSARQMQQIIKDIHKSFTENRDRLGKYIPQ